MFVLVICVERVLVVAAARMKKKKKAPNASSWRTGPKGEPTQAH